MGAARGVSVFGLGGYAHALQVMPYWSRRECGVVTKDDSKTQAACSDSVARTRNE